MATDAQQSGPLPGVKFTQGRWAQTFGPNAGIVGDTDGSAFGITLPPASDVAEIGSATIESVCIVGGFPLIIPAGETQSVTIPASTNPTIGRTDIIAARFDTASYTTDPGPLRLLRHGGTEGSANLPGYDNAMPSPMSWPLWAVTRKQGQSLNQATVRDLRAKSAWTYLIPPNGILPQAAPLGARATRDGITYRRDFVGAAVDWVQEWTLTNAAGATVYDTEWINLSMTTGWKATTGQTPQIRRIGPMVYIRGRVETISGSNVSGSLTPCYIPATTLANTCRPSRDHDYVQQVTAGGGSYRIWVATDGTVNAAGFPADNDMYIATSYAVD
jgi:hypothetical protein